MKNHFDHRRRLSSKFHDKWKPGQHEPPWVRFFGGVLFLGIPLLVLGVILGLVIGGNQELLGSRDFRRMIFCSLPFLVPIIGMLIGSLGLRRFVNPLADVMGAAETLASGDFSVRVEEKGDQEFIKLAKSFNHMAEELQHAEIQRRNLTADVAHELRTPLHILQGNLEGALDGVYQASPEYFKSMLEETRLLQRLVEDLQTLSLAETGNLGLNLQTLLVKDLLEDVVTSFSGQADEGKIQIRLNYPNDLAELTLEGDWHRLDQVVGNLVSNALRYTQEGGEIVLSADKDDTGVIITIQDSGAGIPEEDLPYVFDRFWKGDKTRSRASGGSGLGLAIARQLVNAHGGTIEVESEEGVGTKFTVLLPLLD
jgi:two-component system OmpR family sensor kinase/two-component system sensor histidine kinase BaeS